MNSSVDLYGDVVGKVLAQLGDAIERLGHQLLSRQPGMDAHAEHEVRPVRRGDGVRGGGLRIEGDSHAEIETPSLSDGLGRLALGLDMEGDTVAAGRLDLLEVPLRIGDHQVTVEDAPTVMDEIGDRLDHDRSDRDLGDEVTVSHVVVEDPSAGVEQRFELRTQGREVARVDRRLDLDTSAPISPGQCDATSAFA